MLEIAQNTRGTLMEQVADANMVLEQSKPIKLKLSPMVRWMLSFDREVEAFPNLFSRETLRDLSTRYHAAEDRLQKMSQTLVKIDLLLLLSLYAPSLREFRLFGQSISDFSFLTEIFLLSSTIASLQLFWYFTTARCYESMVATICNRCSNDACWNGKYLTAIAIDQHLALHVVSQKLNIDPRPPERWVAGGKMSSLESTSKLLILLTIWPMISLHLGVLLWGILVLPIRAAIGMPLDLIIAGFAATVLIYTVMLAIWTHHTPQEYEAHPFS
jgi:hypothetical protein